mmetsp:Transcript_27718/g.31976  ORF Transcript_27718/g.31976 Transcript_27718/m.31976 type:complete len:118 (+) Transcript_27718:123-476(+)
MSTKERDTYKEHGWSGVLVDFIYKTYFSYNFLYQTDEIAAIICNKVYVTPLILRSIKGRYNIEENQKQELLKTNLHSIYQKINRSDYEIEDELQNLIDPMREMTPKEVKKRFSPILF